MKVGLIKERAECVIASIFSRWLEAGKVIWEVKGLPRQEYRNAAGKILIAVLYVPMRAAVGNAKCKPGQACVRHEVTGPGRHGSLKAGQGEMPIA